MADSYPPRRAPDGRSAPASWRDQAACRETDPELFFPCGTSGPALDQIKQAKAVCARCKVSRQCLEYAVRTHQDAGVWGGMDEEERRRLRRSWDRQ